MRTLEEIKSNPAILEEYIERWTVKDDVFQFKGFVKVKNSRKHVRASCKFSRLNGWEHLTIGFDDETPSWDLMCEVKDIFWSEDEVTMQLHPKKEEYINNHEHTLHMWRPLDKEIPTPPFILVGFRGPEHKEEDIQLFMNIQKENGNPITRAEAERYWFLAQPENMKLIAKLNLAAEKGNFTEVLTKMLGGK